MTIGRGPLLLMAGVLAGLGLAAVDLIGAKDRRGEARLGPDVVAVVNGRAVRRDDYERALRAVAADRRDGAIDEALRRRVLDRLIDEELLVERALELGLAERDPTVRANLASAVMSLVGARAEDEDDAPGDAELDRFLDENRALFREPPRLRLRLLPGDAAPPPALRLPDGPLPIAKWRDYLGEPIVALLAVAAEGARVPIDPRSGPGGGAVEVVERRPARDPALDEIRDAVLAERRRRAGDRRLRALLDERRASSEIEIREGALAPAPAASGYNPAK